MPTIELIFANPWRLEPTVAAGVAVLSLLYALAWVRRRSFGFDGPVNRTQVARFGLAMVVILLALHPIVDELADRYALSVHMVQHMLLGFVMPIPLLLGTPDWLLRPLTRVRDIDQLARLVTFPVVALALFNVYFAVLHLPRFYNHMLNDKLVHVASHLTIIVTAVIMWWPVFGSLPEWPKPGSGAQLLYLVAMGVPMSILGALITYSPDVLYQTYLRAPRVLPWSPLEDQAFAGGLMWIGGLMYLLLVLTVLFFKWAQREMADDEIAEAT